MYGSSNYSWYNIAWQQRQNQISLNYTFLGSNFVKSITLHVYIISLQNNSVDKNLLWNGLMGKCSFGICRISTSQATYHIFGGISRCKPQKMLKIYSPCIYTFCSHLSFKQKQNVHNKCSLYTITKSSRSSLISFGWLPKILQVKFLQLLCSKVFIIFHNACHSNIFCGQQQSGMCNVCLKISIV